MPAKVKPIPDGYHTVTPYLLAADVRPLLDFLQRGLGAVEVEKMTAPDGSIRHAEVRIGDSMVMLGAAGGDYPPMPCMLYLYVEDVDALYQRALDAGATPVQPPADQFYGDRSGGVRDAAGNQWWMATHVEDVPPDELARRAAAAKR